MSNFSTKFHLPEIMGNALKKPLRYIAIPILIASGLASPIANAATQHITFTSITGSPTVLDLWLTTSGPGNAWENLTNISGTYHSDAYESAFGSARFPVSYLSAGSYGAGEDNLVCIGQTCADPYGPVSGRIVTQTGIVFSIGIANQTWLFGSGGSSSPFDYSLSASGGLQAPATFGAGVISAVPEPETYAMMIAGLGLVGTIKRRKNIKAKGQRPVD